MEWDAVEYWWTSSELVFIHDSLDLSYNYGSLRSLPLLNRVGLLVRGYDLHTTSPYWFTYPKQWRQLGGVDQFDMEGHEWRLIQEISAPTQPLCIIASDHYETETPYSIGGVISRFSQSAEPVYVVADTRQFQIQEATRPLRDEPYVNELPGGFGEVYDAVVDRYRSMGRHPPLSDTRNLFLQDNAILYNEIQAETPVSTAEKLFAVLEDAPYLPLYGAMVRIFNRSESKGANPLPESERGGFRKWLRRRVEWTNSTATSVSQSLNEAVMTDPNIFAAPTRVNHPTHRPVKRYLSQLDPAESPLDCLYTTWLKHGMTI